MKWCSGISLEFVSFFLQLNNVNMMSVDTLAPSITRSSPAMVHGVLKMYKISGSLFPMFNSLCAKLFRGKENIQSGPLITRMLGSKKSPTVLYGNPW